jgi:DtxR family Mn-dependent transcriptional regulator
MKKGYRFEEILEFIWTSVEEEQEITLKDLVQGLKDISEQELIMTIKEMEEQGVIWQEAGRLGLTHRGNIQASNVVRRHRLAERLLVDLFEIGEKSMEWHACQFEHILSPEVTDSVCTFLGHPPVCYHGKAIPQGKCCTSLQKTVPPLVTNLKELPVGVKARIVFIVPESQAHLNKLASLGIVPGIVVQLYQKKPSFVLQYNEETLIAIEVSIAHNIYVKRIE